MRDQAIIELLLQTGLRLSEVARLHVNHVSLPTKISKEPGFVGSVTVLGKGRKQRFVTLNYKACRAIKTYLSIRSDEEDTHLFLTKFKKALVHAALKSWLRSTSKKQGFPMPQSIPSGTPLRRTPSRREQSLRLLGKPWDMSP